MALSGVMGANLEIIGRQDLSGIVPGWELRSQECWCEMETSSAEQPFNILDSLKGTKFVSFMVEVRCYIY